MPRCPYCPATVNLEDRQCSNCGAPIDKPYYRILENILSPEEEAAVIPPSFIQFFLGLSSIGGGLFGITIILQTLIETKQSIYALIISIGFIGIFCFSVWCGILIIQGRRGWLRQNQLIWLLQIPTFTSPIISYLLTAGPAFTIYTQLLPFNTGFNFSMIGAGFKFNFFNHSPIGFGVNLVALGIYLYLKNLTKSHLTHHSSGTPNGTP